MDRREMLKKSTVAAAIVLASPSVLTDSAGSQVEVTTWTVDAVDEHGRPHRVVIAWG